MNLSANVFRFMRRNLGVSILFGLVSIAAICGMARAKETGSSDTNVTDENTTQSSNTQTALTNEEIDKISKNKATYPVSDSTRKYSLCGRMKTRSSMSTEKMLPTDVSG